MANRQFRKFKPLYLHVCRMYWSQPWLSNIDIAAKVGASPNWIGEILNSVDAKEIFAGLKAKTIDSMLDVQVDLQAIAPLALEEKVSLAMDHNTPPAVRDKSLTDLLAMAGHSPVKRVTINRPDAVTERYRDKTEAEIRDELIRATISDENGPDGRPLN